MDMELCEEEPEKSGVQLESLPAELLLMVVSCKWELGCCLICDVV